MLDKAKFKYTKATMYTSVPRDLTQFKLKDYDVVCLFSPIGVRSLLQSFPNIAEQSINIAAFGTSTHAALKAAGIKLTIAAPTKASPSMAMAIENYINGKGQDEAIISRPSAMKKDGTHKVSSSTTGTVKKTKSVFANKAKYKQLQEERKAQAAARRAERLAAKEAQMKTQTDPTAKAE